MYEAFYGLSCKPFQLNPDHSFYFGSAQHRRAKVYLEYGVKRNEGFIVITGEVGAGKTTIVRGLLASLDPDKVVAAHLVTTQLGADDTLRMVGSAFGVAVKGLSKADVLMALEAYLLLQLSQGKRCLLIVDEAQNLSHHAVEELRMLSNFQLDQQALLQTFLVGQPEFRAILLSPGMKQLRQRVTASCHIGPLSEEETEGYIQHRLKCAGAKGSPQFDAEAYAAIYKASDGIPRRVNMVCDRLLLLGFLEETSSFGAAEVATVVDEIKAESALPDNAGPISTVDIDTSDWNPIAFEDSQVPAPRHPYVLPQTAMHQLNNQKVEQLDTRLRRMEDSMLRLERTHMEILTVLQSLFSAPQKPPTETP